MNKVHFLESKNPGNGMVIALAEGESVERVHSRIAVRISESGGTRAHLYSQGLQTVAREKFLEA